MARESISGASARRTTHGASEHAALLDADVTVQTCWDADRLDLGRVGRRSDPQRLCTAAARDRGLIAWAYERSLLG